MEETQSLTIEGRNAVLEAFRSGKTIDKLFLLDGCMDGPIRTIQREAKKHDTIISYVTKERLDQISETGKHQGVIAYAAAYTYASIDDMLQNGKGCRRRSVFDLCWTMWKIPTIWAPSSVRQIWRGRMACVIPKRRAVGLTATVAKTSAGATQLYAGRKGDKSVPDHRRHSNRKVCGSSVRIWAEAPCMI